MTDAETSLVKSCCNWSEVQPWLFQYALAAIENKQKKVQYLSSSATQSLRCQTRMKSQIWHPAQVGLGKGHIPPRRVNSAEYLGNRTNCEPYQSKSNSQRYGLIKSRKENVFNLKTSAGELKMCFPAESSRSK